MSIKFVNLTNFVGMAFVYVPPCSFIMGSPELEEGRQSNEIQHEVILTMGFYIQTTLITQNHWMELNDENPSYFKMGDENKPVENISWNDCQGFIRKLNESEKAEWECACTAGRKTGFCFENDAEMLKEYAWFYGNSELKSHQVKGKRPNDWGLYDIHGNVWE
jgi:formylglycine-generating enzyme required for sulfatase activity